MSRVEKPLGAPHTKSVYPRISILTPSLNSGAFVGAAVASVARQEYSDIEHIVLDAGSKDGTLDILAQQPGIRVVHTSDTSAHEAMNLGIAQATGDVIGFLNADDLYEGDVLEAVGAAFADDPDLDAVSVCDAVFENALAGLRVTVYRTHIGDGFDLAELTLGVPAFNARFFHRRLFDRVGVFDLHFRIAADRDFLIRAAAAGVRAVHLSKLGYRYRCHEGSPTLNPAKRNAHAIAREHVEIAEKQLENDTLSRPTRRQLKRWHAYECVKLAFWKFRDGAPTEALEFLGQATRHVILWPAAVLSARRCVRRVRRAQCLSSSQIGLIQSLRDIDAGTSSADQSEDEPAPRG